jgi:hypothetical protein
MELRNKNGFFYFIELMMILIVVSIILTHFPVVQKSNVNFQQHENLRQYGFGVMKALDDVGVLPKYINTTTFDSTNFTALRSFTQASFPETIKIQLEYILNSTNCYNQSGSMKPVGNCGLNESARQDAASVMYTFANSTQPVTLRLHMVNLLGGQSTR